MNAAVFDMDGTLVDSAELAIRAAEDGLRDYYAARGLPPLLPGADEIRSLVGLPSLEYFARLLSPERRGDAAEARRRIGAGECERLARGEGRLFPGVRETLQALREKGWRIGLVSNCGRPYLEANLRHLRLGEWVETALCLDDGATKSENVRQALLRLRCAGGVMVGDRAGDLEAGRANGLRTVGCLYGFGAPEELAEADATIGELAELLPLLHSAASLS